MPSRKHLTCSNLPFLLPQATRLPCSPLGHPSKRSANRAPPSPTTKSSKAKPQKNSTAPKPAKTKKLNSAALSTKSPKKSNSSRCLENKKELIMGRNAPTVARKPKKQMMSSAPQLSRITMRRRTCLSSLMWIISGVRSRSRDTSLCNTQHSN